MWRPLTKQKVYGEIKKNFVPTPNSTDALHWDVSSGLFFTLVKINHRHIICLWNKQMRLQVSTTLSKNLCPPASPQFTGPWNGNASSSHDNHPKITFVTHFSSFFKPHTQKIQYLSSVIVQFLCILLTLTGEKAATNGEDYPEGKKSRTKETRDWVSPRAQAAGWRSQATQYKGSTHNTTMHYFLNSQAYSVNDSIKDLVWSFLGNSDPKIVLWEFCNMSYLVVMPHFIMVFVLVWSCTSLVKMFRVLSVVRPESATLKLWLMKLHLFFLKNSFRLKAHPPHICDILVMKALPTIDPMGCQINLLPIKV